jgi:hypothetical protein
MGRLVKRLESDRATRDAARGAFDLRLAQVRQDVDARGIGGRIADKITEDAFDVIDEAVEIADSNRGVIAGTIAAVAIWIFRHPIIAWIEGLMEAKHEEEASDERH